MDATTRLKEALQASATTIGKVVDHNGGERLFPMDLTAANTGLNAGIISDAGKFSQWINEKLLQHNCRYGIGGYMEHRTIYAGIPLFETEAEPRRLHLGVDIWSGAGTAVYAPLEGIIHSFNDNNYLGDYGPTIILSHKAGNLSFYSLYGHLSRANLNGLYAGMPVKQNERVGNMGEAQENGNWPPHLHFQLMLDMEGHTGDYPGACKLSEKEKYLMNIPDAGLLLAFS